MTQELGFLHQDSFLHVVNCLAELALPAKVASIDRFLINLDLPENLIEPNLWEIDDFAGAFLTAGSESQNGEPDPKDSVIVTHAFVSTTYSATTNPPSQADRRVLFDLFAEQTSWAVAELGQPTRRQVEKIPTAAWMLPSGSELQLQVGRSGRLELNSPRTVELRRIPAPSKEYLDQL